MMTTQQLSFFPDMKAQIATTYRTTQTIGITKKKVPTKRAAAILGVTDSTLHNAKRQGKTSYRKDDMEAHYVGKGKKSFLWMIIQYR